ncbi:sulfatase [Propionibacteriaceae bacterium Y2011]
MEVQNPARIVFEAIEWLDAEPEAPALAWLSIPEPHVPYQVPEPYFSDFGPDVVPQPDTTSEALDGAGLPWQWVRRLGKALDEADPDTLQRARASYVGMLRLIDDQIGRLLDHLAETGRLESTLIVFVSDHGDYAGEYGLLRKGAGVPEVLTRVPMFFSGAGVGSDICADGPSPAHVSMVDVFPTICELAGWPVPNGVQGRSLVPLLQGEVPAGEFDSSYAEQGVGGLPHPGGPGIEDLLSPGRAGAPGADVPVATLCDVTQDGALRMVRSGRWKLIMQVTGETQLYDLEEDRYELHDRHADPACAEVYVSMLEHLAKWLIRVADPLPIPDGGHPRVSHPRNYHWGGGSD